MVLITPGKRKLLNTTSSNTSAKKRTIQTISGMINSELAATANRAAKKPEPPQPNKETTRKTSAVIKNTVEFMSKSKLIKHPNSKFLSSKLRNSGTYLNHDPASMKPIRLSTQKLLSHKSQYKKSVLPAQQIEDTQQPTEPPISPLSYSKENLKEQEQLYEKKLNNLRYQFEKLEGLKSFELTANVLVESVEANLIDSNGNENHAYLIEFIDGLRQLKKESVENMSVVRNWFEMQTAEANAHFNAECGRAVHEFQEKRRELKDTLRADNEEKRRQIDIDRHLLDINMDMADAKPKITRKLRRRVNNPGTAANANSSSGLLVNSVDFSVDTSNSCLDAAPVNATAVLLQASVVGSGGVAASLSGGAVSVVSAPNLVQAHFSSYCNALVSVNERKKKLAPATTITFALSEEDINEDLKCLV